MSRNTFTPNASSDLWHGSNGVTEVVAWPIDGDARDGRAGDADEGRTPRHDTRWSGPLDSLLAPTVSTSPQRAATAAEPSRFNGLKGLRSPLQGNVLRVMAAKLFTTPSSVVDKTKCLDISFGTDEGHRFGCRDGRAHGGGGLRRDRV
jgi:hypothetical protein